MNVKVIYPDSEDQTYIDGPRTCTIFLAGTIDNGNSENWQEQYIEAIKKMNVPIFDNVIIFNPRRKNWNDNPTQEDLEYQIKWELEHQEKSDRIYMNILGNSKSPITLLELGLFARTCKLYVICPKEYYRYTNVKVTCEKYNVPLKHTMYKTF